MTKFLFVLIAVLMSSCASEPVRPVKKCHLNAHGEEECVFQPYIYNRII